HLRWQVGRRLRPRHLFVAVISTTRNFCRRIGVPAALAVAVDGRLTLIEVAGLEIGVTIRDDR
ncbi:MAG: hypothetical protein VX085_11915, partial [Pseudomonadota bacterium]|nr:hypothetical protein [Pseudomonadota bacterium]